MFSGCQRYYNCVALRAGCLRSLISLWWQLNISKLTVAYQYWFQARRWVYCEFFYSGVDQQLFLDDNEFTMLLRELFPNLRTKKLCRPEWRAIRRLIGKPRRCSDSFLCEERKALEQKRYALLFLKFGVRCWCHLRWCHIMLEKICTQSEMIWQKTVNLFFTSHCAENFWNERCASFRAKIRQIYDGTYITMPPNASELPLQLPRPLAVGAKIYARVRAPRDGIYAGTVDAVLPDSYRVVFDKEEMIPPMIIKDFEIMSAHPVCIVSSRITRLGLSVHLFTYLLSDL